MMTAFFLAGCSILTSGKIGESIRCVPGKTMDLLADGNAVGIGSLTGKPPHLLCQGLKGDGWRRIFFNSQPLSVTPGNTVLLELVAKVTHRGEGGGLYITCGDENGRKSKTVHLFLHGDGSTPMRALLTIPADWKNPGISLGALGSLVAEIKSFTVRSLAPESLNASISFGQDLSVSALGTELPVQGELTLRSGPARRVAVTCVIRDQDGAVLMRERKAVDLVPESAVKVNFGSLRPKRYGIFEAWLETEDGLCAVRAIQALAPVIPRWSPNEPDRVFFGIHEPKLIYEWRFPKEGDLEKAVRLLAASGAGLLRFDLGWNENNENAYERNRLGKVLELFPAQGMVLLPTLGGTPERYRTAPHFPTREQVKAKAPWYNYDDLVKAKWHLSTVIPNDLGAYSRWVEDTLRVCGPAVNHWEVRNEPDWWDFWLGTAEDYIKLLDVTEREIHRISPAAKVMNGGLTMEGTVDEQFVSKMLSAPVAARLDAVAIHCYDKVPDELAGKRPGTGGDAKQDIEGRRRNKLTRLADMQAELAKAGLAKPIWITEGNAHAHAPRAAASVIPRKFALYRAIGAGSFAYYESGLGSEVSFALFDGWEPRLSFLSYATCVSMLRGSSFEKRYDLPQGGVAFRFRRAGGGAVTVAWRQGEEQSEKLPIQVPVKSAVLTFDMIGNAAEIKVSGGKATAFLSDEPVYLVE